MRALALFLTAALLLSACNLSGPRPPAEYGGSERARVENWRGGSGTVEALLRSEGGAARVASGTVSATGELEFVLGSADAAHLTPFTACPDITVSDPALKLGSFSALEVLDERGVQQGWVALVSDAAVLERGLKRAGDFYVQYTYADRAARVEGGCAIGGAPGSFTYALELSAGWNPVVFKLAGPGALHLSTGTVPEGATWFFSGVVR